MKNVKTFSQFIIAGFTILVLIIILRSLMNSPTGLSIRQAYSKEAENLAAENAIKIQQQKDRAVWMRWKAEELKARVASEESLQKIKNLPDKALRWSAFWWGAVVSSIALMFFTACLLSVAIYKMARSNSDLVAMAIMLRGRSKEDLLLAREELRLEGTRLKYFDKHPELIIDAQAPIAIDAKSSVPTAAQCLQDGLFTREGNRFLWGFDEDAQPYFMTLKEGFKAAIIGTTDQGKTYRELMLAVQCFYKGWQGIIIDLNYSADRSLWEYMKPFQESKSIYWCTEQEDVNNTLNMAYDIHLKRLQGGAKHPLVIIIDDMLGIANNLEYTEAFNRLTIPLATEGTKYGESMIATSHNWQADLIPKQFRSNLNYRCAFNCDPGEARLLFQDKKNKYSGQVQSLKPGECLLLDKGELNKLYGPHWDIETIERMAAQAIDAPAIQPQEAFALPDLREYKGFHIVDGGKTA